MATWYYYKNTFRYNPESTWSVLSDWFRQSNVIQAYSPPTGAADTVWIDYNNGKTYLWISGAWVESVIEHPTVAPWTTSNAYLSDDLSYVNDNSSRNISLDVDIGVSGNAWVPTGTCSIRIDPLAGRTIYSGTFTGGIQSGSYCFIRGGVFTGYSDLQGGIVYGGTFTGSQCYLGYLVVIFGGVFTGNNCSYDGGMYNGDGIYGGVFTGSGFTNGGRLFGGVFTGASFTNDSLIGGGLFLGSSFTNSSQAVLPSDGYDRIKGILGGIFNVASLTNNGYIAPSTFWWKRGNMKIGSTVYKASGAASPSASFSDLETSSDIIGTGLM